MKLYNNFTGGAMNKDLELRVFPKSVYLDAQNIRITTPAEQNSLAVNFTLGNTVKTALSMGANAECIGSCVDSFRNKIYWAVVSDSGSYICEFDVATETENIVLSDTRSGAANLFGFVSGGYVEMRVLNDDENGKNFLALTDGQNEPKFFNIETAKGLTDSSFTLEDVSLIKSPPLSAPSITLNNTDAIGENNLEAKFLSFAYRYKYQNDEFSALSQFSEFAFLPQNNFSYNYNSGTNLSMFNSFSKVDINLVAGSSNVQEIQLIVKESGSNTAYIVDTYDNTTQTVTFDNSRIYRALDSNQLTRIYDNVPISAKTMEIIGNRIVFANYTEGYDLTYNGADSNLAFGLDYVSATGTSGSVHKQVKTNRDYEIAIAYEDGKGRITTPIVSPENTTYVPYSVADEKVQLRLTIDKNSRPPEWATGYRLYIKQSKTNYDNIAPITFYRDGVFAWVRLEGNDVQKTSEGDFIYVKSDTSDLKTSVIRTKVLEISVKERNFLETDETIKNGVETLQKSGTYMRTEVRGFNLDPTAVSEYNMEVDSPSAFRSDSTDNNLSNNQSYIEAKYFQGTGLDDLTVSGTYTGSDDIRYEVQVDGVVGTNTFQWREYNVSTDTLGSWTSLVAMTGGAQAIGTDGVSITFNATTGHTVNDRWFISAKSQTRCDEFDAGGGVGANNIRYKAMVIYQGKPISDERIKAGAIIRLTYNDSDSASQVRDKQGDISIELTSSSEYPNLEEWFFGDNIIDEIGQLADDTTTIMFRRGDFDKTPTGQRIAIDPTKRMNLIISSPAWWLFGSSSEIRIDHSFIITEFNNNILFETIPVDVTTDIFYELPYRYDISSNRHEGDTNQVFGVTDAVVTLDYFNSFGWYNGFESIKIGDTFNENIMVLDTKPLIPIENYQQIMRKASLSYSDVYESTTQFNALNEFNLAEVNYKDMDIKYGGINKLYSNDTDLTVFQHDKTHRLLFSKSVLFNGDGSGNVTQSSNVLGQEVAFTGEYGICNNPESFAFFGNRIYHLDKDRGALMRLSVDGYTEISQQGMKDYFRTLPSISRFVGGYDPYNDEYLINLAEDSSPQTLSFQEGVGFSSFYEYQPERLIGVNNRLYSIKAGQIWLHDSNSTYNNFYGEQRTASITTVFNDSPNDIKHFKSINTESNSPWDITLTTQSAGSTIAAEEFSLDEFEYYAYIRQGENTAIGTATESLGSFKGIGEITNITGLVVSFGFSLPRSISVGDVIWEYNTGTEVSTERGTITAINHTAGTITLDAVTGLVVGDYLLASKNVRVEGESCKGYTLKVKMTNDSSTYNRLFAVKVEAVKSFD